MRGIVFFYLTFALTVSASNVAACSCAGFYSIDEHINETAEIVRGGAVRTHWVTDTTDSIALIQSTKIRALDSLKGSAREKEFLFVRHARGDSGGCGTLISKRFNHEGLATEVDGKIDTSICHGTRHAPDSHKWGWGNNRGILDRDH